DAVSSRAGQAMSRGWAARAGGERHGPKLGGCETAGGARGNGEARAVRGAELSIPSDGTYGGANDQRCDASAVCRRVVPDRIHPKPPAAASANPRLSVRIGVGHELPSFRY